MFPKTLAIDFGTRKIGLALSYGTLAEPFGILQNSPEVFAEIRKICESELVEQILIGVSDGKSAENAKNFANDLGSNINLPIFMTDETLSTKVALAKIKEIKGKAYRGDDDHIASAVILQEWIDTNPDLHPDRHSDLQSDPNHNPSATSHQEQDR